MSRPLIQIDDEIREMTDEEFAEHQTRIASAPTLPANDDE
jgi:hypothetical protein